MMKSLSSVMSAGRVDASVWDGEECVSQCSLERDAPCERDTGEYSLEQSGRKEKERMCSI
jgi:hypothetical protein